MAKALTPVYEPSPGRKMRVAVFFSGGASAFKAMLDSDPNYGKLYEVVAGVTNNEVAGGIPLFTDRGIEVLRYPLKFRSFDVEAAKPMYEEVLQGLNRFDPDIIALSGFMRIVTFPLIEQREEMGEYSGRVFNVHPAPLYILTGPGVERLNAWDMDPVQVTKLAKANRLKRRYKGGDAVTDAVISGEHKTSSTVHIATEVYDEGPVVVTSRDFEIDDAMRSSALRPRPDRRRSEQQRQYARELQERMKVEGDGPAYVKALEMTARGELEIERRNGLFVVYRSGERLPYQGVQL